MTGIFGDLEVVSFGVVVSPEPQVKSKTIRPLQRPTQKTNGILVRESGFGVFRVNGKANGRRRKRGLRKMLDIKSDQK